MNLKEFRENANKENLCAEYAAIWDSCKSKKQYMDMCLGIKGIDYVCDAYAKGWGIDKEYFTTELKQFINGKFVYEEKDRYTSEMYCDFKGSIKVRTDLLMLLDCDIELELAEGCCYQVFASGKCNIVINGKADVYIFTYGKKGSVNISGNADIRHKHKTKRDEY